MTGEERTRAQAAILSLEEFRDAQRRAEVRQRLHDPCDAWWDRLEARGKDPPPTLAELRPVVFALRPELTPAVTEGLGEQAHRAVVEQRTAACPPCGQPLSARGPQARTVETLVGASRLRRPACDCEHCQRGSAPLDAALGLPERRQPPAVQQAAVQWTQEVPDETAGELGAELTGLSLSAHTAHEMTEAVAAGLTVLDVAPTRAEITAKMEAVAAGQHGRPILVLAMAGADVPTRPETAKDRPPGRKRARAQRARWTGEGREANGLRCYLMADDRLVPVWSGHPIHTDEAAAAALRQVQAAGFIPASQVRLWVMAAGARGIWQQAQAWFPWAVEIWDDDPCRAHLHQVAAGQ